MKYVKINGDGQYAFYMSGDITPVPEGALKVAEKSYERFFASNQSEYKWVDNGNGYASLVGVTLEPAPEVFKDLTPRQFAYVLIEIGLKEADILAEIDKIEDEKAREIARADYLKATSFSRDYPLIDQIATKMGIPPEQVDALWRFGEDS